MPRFDKTGPEGQGPLSGRGKGNCRSNGTSDEQVLATERPLRRRLQIFKNKFGEGRGRGQGRGRK